MGRIKNFIWRLLPSSKKQVTDRLNKLEKKVDSLIKLEEKTSAKFESLNEKILILGKEFSENIQLVGERFEVLNEKVGAFEKSSGEKFEILNKKVCAFEKSNTEKFESLNEKILILGKEFSENIQFVGEKLESLNEKVGAFEKTNAEKFEALNEKIFGFEKSNGEKIEALKTISLLLERKTNELYERFGIISTRLEVSEKSTANNFTGLNEKLSAVSNGLKDKLQKNFTEMLTANQKKSEESFTALNGKVGKLQEQEDKLKTEIVTQIKQSTNSRFDRLENIHLRHTPKKFLSFEVSLAEHCNLRCAGCTHFSPIAEPEFADIKEFAKDFERLAKLFPSNGEDAQVKGIHLMGGEPLLHPELNLFLPIARENFPDAEIQIVTNGILLPNMNNEFWTACRENKITICPTKYPIDFDYDAMEKTAKDKGVEYYYYGSSGTTLKTMYKLPLDLKGLQDERKSFMLCARANGNCLYLHHGHLYTCPVATTARHLNKRFGVKLQEHKEDSIDIYSVESAKKIMEFLSHPIPFCRYCMIGKTVYNLPWKQSGFELSEWTL